LWSPAEKIKKNGGRNLLASSISSGEKDEMKVISGFLALLFFLGAFLEECDRLRD